MSNFSGKICKHYELSIPFLEIYHVEKNTHIYEQTIQCSFAFLRDWIKMEMQELQIEKDGN